ncbi:MAG: tetratricopeptide repeat protein [Candidatus Binataceae bacterium]|jgi:TolA-binding protein
MAVLNRYLNRCALVLALVAPAAIAGCAQMPWQGSANTPTEASAVNLADLQSMVAADHQAIVQLTERNRQLEEQVKQLSEHAAVAPAGGEANEGRIATINQRLSKLESASTAVQTTLSRAIGRAVRPVSVGAEEPVPLPSYDVLLDHEIGLTEGEHRQQGADQLYRDGLIGLRGFRWATAIESFDALEKRYPRAATIERARYFSAIAYYQDGKYDQAIVKFRNFISRYPKSNLTSTAELNLALCYVQVKDQGDARAVLKKIVTNYPATSEATVARATLKDIEPASAEAHK